MTAEETQALRAGLAELADQVRVLTQHHIQTANDLNRVDMRLASTYDLIRDLGAALIAAHNEVNAAHNQVRNVLAALAAMQDAAGRGEKLNWLRQRAMVALLGQDRGLVAPVVAPPLPVNLEQQFASLKARVPDNFAVWLACYQASLTEYAKRLSSSLSTPEHPVAFDFRAFVAVHGKGRFLDIGVGPLAKPAYLRGVADVSIGAVDPLPPYEPHPFAFAQSLAEFLPWPDHSFDTVIAATSLDHVFLLDVALDEIRRVLAPGGLFLVWAGIFAETPPYDPYAGPVTPLDAFHLFHPGENWFVETLSRKFRLVERFEAAHTNSFLALEPRR